MSPGMRWRTGERFDPQAEARFVVPGTKLPLYRVVLICRRTAIGAFLVAVAAGLLLFTAGTSTSGRAFLGITLFVGAVGIGIVATLAGMVAGVARGVLAARAAWPSSHPAAGQSEPPALSAAERDRGQDAR